MLYNLTKDGKWVLKRSVSEVLLYEVGSLAGSAGYLGKSAVMIKAVPRTTELIDGSKYQLGFDVSYEITSEQFYSVFEFEKLMNKKGYIHIPDIPLWIGTYTGGMITFNIEVDVNPGETKGQVKLSGSKYVSKLTDFMAQNWDGAVAPPFAVPTVPTESTTQIGGSLFTYEYVLSTTNPYVKFVNPVNPDSDDQILQFKLALLGDAKDSMRQLSTPPSNVVFQYFNGMAWVSVPTDDYSVIYENSFYYIQYLDSGSNFKLGDKFRVTYNR